MKLKHKLTILVSLSFIFIATVLFELLVNWQAVTHALNQKKRAEQIDFWVDRLEVDFNYYLQNHSPKSTDDWLDSYKNLNEALRLPDKNDVNKNPQITSIINQTKGLRTLFDGLVNLDHQRAGEDIKAHVADKIIANIQSIREESRSVSQTNRNNITDVLTRQLYRTAPILIIGVLVIAFFAFYLVRWLNRAIKRLNKRIELLKEGQLGSFYKPDEDDEFMAIFNEINELSRRLVETTISRDTLQNIVNERTKMLENLANTDPLTEVSTRRVLFKRGHEEFERAKRHDSKLSVLMIDCDFFKKINDTYGHSTGDSVLIHLCRIFENEIRQVDILARFGGEEFVIVLPETDVEGAHQIARRIQKGIKQNPFVSHGKQINLTVSIGVAEMHNQSKNFEQLIDAADIALFKAKDSGRNAIQVSRS